MTSEEFQSKCVQISHFIHYELSNWIDLAVFTQNSFEDLGELYYQHILNVRIWNELCRYQII